MRIVSQGRGYRSDRGGSSQRFIIVILLIIMMALATPLSAGDKAEFLNLGFSPDSSTFFYGQHGIDTVSNSVYVIINGLDLDSGTLIPELSFTQTFSTRVIPGQQSSLAAIIRSVSTYEEFAGVTLDPMDTGRVLYYVLPGNAVGDVVTFVDYRDDMIYDVAFSERPLGASPGDSAAVNVTVYVSPLTGETTMRYDSDSLADFEDSVYDYILKQIIISPDFDYLVCMFQTRVYDENSGTSIRYSMRRVSLKP